MNLVAGACAASLTAGVLLVGTGVHARGPDPVLRALGDRVRTASVLDRWLDAWSRRIGWERQIECLVVVGKDRREHRRAQAGVTVATAALVAMVLALRGPSIEAVVWGALAVPAALLLLEQHLHRRAAQLRQRIGGQVLRATEHVTLAVTAGATVAEAIGLAAASAPAPLAEWLADVDAQVRSGRPLAASLREASGRLQVPELTRLTDTVLTAAERGTPLADTLMAQVADQRARQRAADMARAGRAEIAMIVPVVFLVLPCVVVVALFPGAQVLTTF